MSTGPGPERLASARKDCRIIREMKKVLAAATLVLSSCYVDEMYRGGAPLGPGEPFGYLTAGLLVHVDYSGDLDLETGTGWRVSVPPLVPFVLATDVALVFGMVALAVAAEDAGVYVELDGLFLIPPDEPAVWTSGMRGPRPLLSEVSWELTAEGSTHGSDNAFRLLAGLKVGANRDLGLRPYGSGGWSWHWIDLSGADDISANGPYLGGGIELFGGPTGCVGLDARWHYVRAEGYETSRLLTLELSWSAHW